MRWAIGLVMALALLFGAATIVDHHRKQHERLLHFAWHAAYHTARSEAEAVVTTTGAKVWAEHSETQSTGCQYRNLFMKLPKSGKVGLSSRTINMWGYSQYGWEPWSETSEEVRTALKTYIAGLDSTTKAYAQGWMKYHVD